VAPEVEGNTGRALLAIALFEHGPVGGRGFKGLATRAALTAHACLRAAAHTMASPAVYMFSLPRKAVLKFEAAMASMMTAHVSCGRVPKAFFTTLGPERQGWKNLGVS
jgi:hypothetical protein